MVAAEAACRFPQTQAKHHPREIHAELPSPVSLTAAPCEVGQCQPQRMRGHCLRQPNLPSTVCCCKFRHIAHFVLVFVYEGILAQKWAWRTDLEQNFCCLSQASENPCNFSLLAEPVLAHEPV